MEMPAGIAASLDGLAAIAGSRAETTQDAYPSPDLRA